MNIFNIIMLEIDQKLMSKFITTLPLPLLETMNYVSSARPWHPATDCRDLTLISLWTANTANGANSGLHIHKS